MKTNTFTTVSLVDFVNHPTDTTPGDECVHIVPGDRTITFVRLVESVTEGADENVRIKTEVEGRLTARGTRDGGRRPESLCYHGAQASTILTWLRSLARERGETGVAVDYWEKNNSPALDAAGVKNESLFLTYSVADRVEEVAVEGVYTTPAHMNARFTA